MSQKSTLYWNPYWRLINFCWSGICHLLQKANQLYIQEEVNWFYSATNLPLRTEIHLPWGIEIHLLLMPLKELNYICWSAFTNSDPSVTALSPGFEIYLQLICLKESRPTWCWFVSMNWYSVCCCSSVLPVMTTLASDKR